MLIIAHRGYHAGSKDLENSINAIETADLSGWGSEIDLRVNDTDIVLSHDPVKVGKFYERYAALRPLKNPLFLHVKESKVTQLPAWWERNSGMFSFGYPVRGTTFLQTITSLRGLEWIVRDAWIEQPSGEWVSSAPIWVGPRQNIFVVSPELHGYELTDDLIESYKSKKWIAGICTDYPERWQ